MSSSVLFASLLAVGETTSILKPVTSLNLAPDTLKESEQGRGCLNNKWCDEDKFCDKNKFNILKIVTAKCVRRLRVGRECRSRDECKKGYYCFKKGGSIMKTCETKETRRATKRQELLETMSKMMDQLLWQYFKDSELYQQLSMLVEGDNFNFKHFNPLDYLNNKIKGLIEKQQLKINRLIKEVEEVDNFIKDTLINIMDKGAE